ncbi:Putative ribonuclease H protein At1g65750 [Linum perenne]
MCKTLTHELDITLTQDSWRYLSVPVLHDRVENNIYKGIIERIERKLSGWKGKSLALPGRVTLDLLVLSAILIFAMHTSVLSAPTCEEIDKCI